MNMSSLRYSLSKPKIGNYMVPSNNNYEIRKRYVSILADVDNPNSKLAEAYLNHRDTTISPPLDLEGMDVLTSMATYTCVLSLLHGIKKVVQSKPHGETDTIKKLNSGEHKSEMNFTLFDTDADSVIGP